MTDTETLARTENPTVKDWTLWAERTLYGLPLIGQLSCVLNSIEPVPYIETTLRNYPDKVAGELCCSKEKAEAIIDTYRALHSACEEGTLEGLFVDSDGDLIISSSGIYAWTIQTGREFPPELLEARKALNEHNLRLNTDPLYNINHFVSQGQDMPPEYLSRAYWGLAEACHIAAGLDPAGWRTDWRINGNLEKAVYCVELERGGIPSEYGVVMQVHNGKLYQKAYVAICEKKLEILNPEDRDPREWRTTPVNFIRWCYDCGIKLRPQLLGIIGEQYPTTPSGKARGLNRTRVVNALAKKIEELSKKFPNEKQEWYREQCKQYMATIKFIDEIGAYQWEGGLFLNNKKSPCAWRKANLPREMREPFFARRNNM